MTPADVEIEFRGWHVWRSDRTWWATRTGRPLSEVQFNAGMATTVCGDDADKLRTELFRQRSAEDRYAELVASR